MKNWATGQFAGNMRQIFLDLLTTYGKILPSQLNNFEKEVTAMHYDPVTPAENIFNKVKDLLKYGDMAN